MPLFREAVLGPAFHAGLGVPRHPVFPAPPAAAGGRRRRRAEREEYRCVRQAHPEGWAYYRWRGKAAEAAST